MGAVLIGVDPAKRSNTIEVIDSNGNHGTDTVSIFVQ